eukprot:TRINITY_DN2642_c0_g1_i1.p1 TRINITY_DN2642_c0_g1~~TRINITY_DN2642_c0_g1_i1.p1  ORF type:complete len:139 (-),score=24.87 TRINITY_DN2642_c0_g1_i1:44-460(-)
MSTIVIHPNKFLSGNKRNRRDAELLNPRLVSLIVLASELHEISTNKLKRIDNTRFSEHWEELHMSREMSNGRHYNQNTRNQTNLSVSRVVEKNSRQAGKLSLDDILIGKKPDQEHPRIPSILPFSPSTTTIPVTVVLE